MKIIEFIKVWADMPDQDPIMAIPTTEAAHPNIQIITTGTSTKKHCYGWSCDDKCLYYQDQPVCYKVYGLIACNKVFIPKLRPFFRELDITSYIYEGDITNFANGLACVFESYYRGAVDAEICDEIVLQVMHSLKCKYEAGYLNYCKKLDASTFRTFTEESHRKREIRSICKPITKKLVGLWYSPEPNFCYDRMATGIAAAGA